MKKIVVSSLFLIAALATLGWVFKSEVLLAVVSFQTDRQYAEREPFYEVPWQQGPIERVLESATSSQASSTETPPNIILIVADDLGFNDISTFGGGVANGRIKTPNIDKLAAEGMIFSQSYSGANTCAPSRGMLMTGRYPSRTGFNFTPTPGSMGKLVGLVADGIDNGLPDGVFDEDKAASKPPYEQQGLPASELTVAEILKTKGYYNAHIGKSFGPTKRHGSARSGV